MLFRSTKAQGTPLARLPLSLNLNACVQKLISNEPEMLMLVPPLIVLTKSCKDTRRLTQSITKGWLEKERLTKDLEDQLKKLNSNFSEEAKRDREIVNSMESLARKIEDVVMWQPGKEENPALEGTPDEPRFKYIKYD